METNSVILGETLNELSLINDESIDLIYLDPPFFSNRHFVTSTIMRTTAYFDDIWSGGLEEYLLFMRKIVLHCNRILKPTGSVYLHCDWHASHYLKVEADRIFGYDNFRNEIVWKRHNSHNDAKQGTRIFGRIHDSILFYSKTDDYVWNPIHTPYNKKYVKKYYRYTDEKTGRLYALGDLTGPGGAGKGNPLFEFNGHTRYWRYNKEKMEELKRTGKIVLSRNTGYPYLKRYLDEMKGISVQDMWDDIKSPQLTRKEYCGYPTQKPIGLLERIIAFSTRKNDIVLDPFCGSGTTLVAAQKLGRKWLGIDNNRQACEIACHRLRSLGYTVFPICTSTLHCKKIIPST